jgi:2'-5' RNA ligase
VVTGIERAFVAVVPPPAVLDAVARALAPIRATAPPQLAWSRRAQWHVTLQFLGRVHDVDVLADALAATFDATARFPTRLGTTGAFPSVARAQVLWLGLDPGADGVVRLAAAVQRATAPLGYEPDDRAFTPHLTVARCRRPRPLEPLLAALGDGPFGPVWDVREAELIESDTRPTGAVHRVVRSFTLGR